jgi:hypothetical protein
MTDRYDAVAVREYDVNGETRSSFTNIGVAFALKERDGYSLKLHCLPAPVDGEYKILLFPPKPKEDREPPRQERRQNYAQQSGGRSQRDLDDDIPF